MTHSKKHPATRRLANFAKCLPLGVVLMMAGTLCAVAEIYRIDPARTEISFEIGAKGYPLTHGVFRVFTSNLSIDFDHPARSAVTFKVAAGSLDTNAPALDAYVRGPVFLNADRFPSISFVSTGVEKLDDHTVRVMGDLTLLGTTLPESFTVAVDHGAGKGSPVSFQAEGAIRRSQFGMTGGLPLVSDDVRIIVSTRVEAP